MTMRKTKAWTKNSEEAKWLRENIKGRSTKELAEMMTKHFGYEISRNHVKNYIGRHKLKSGYGKALLSKAQYAWLKDNCAGLTYAAMQQLIADKFGVHLTIAQVNSLRSRNKMNSGLTGRFEKGSTPWNKGIHFQAGGRCTETQFKKGNKPHNTKPVGYESVDKDGYVHFKPPGSEKMVIKHTYLWKQAYGPIPPGKCLIFLDGNKLNCDLSNLKLIDRATHARMNQRHLYTSDPEYTKLGIATAELIAARYKRKKYRQYKSEQQLLRKNRNERK